MMKNISGTMPMIRFLLLLLLLMTAGIGSCEETADNRMSVGRFRDRNRFPVFDNRRVVRYSPVGSFQAAVPDFSVPGKQVKSPTVNAFILPRRKRYEVSELPDTTNLPSRNSNRMEIISGQRGFPPYSESVSSNEINSVMSIGKNKKFSSGLDTTGIRKPFVKSGYGPAKTSDYFQLRSSIRGGGGLSKYRRLTDDRRHRYSFHGPKNRVYLHNGRQHRRSHHKRHPSFRKYHHPVKYGSSGSVRFVKSPASKKNPGKVENGDSMMDTRFSSEPSESVRKWKNSPVGGDSRRTGNDGMNGGHFAQIPGTGDVPHQQENSLMSSLYSDSSLASANGLINSYGFSHGNPYGFDGFPGSVSVYRGISQPTQYLDSSETVKIPIAIIRGAHDLTGTGIWGFAANNRREKKSSDDPEKKFHPSKKMSDWIPVVGTARTADMGKAIQETRRENGKDSFFPRSDSSPSETGNGHAFRPTTSGNDLNRFSTGSDDVITGKMPRPPSGGFMRKGSVTDVHTSSLVSDTSDMIVSSVIKFSQR